MITWPVTSGPTDLEPQTIIIKCRQNARQSYKIEPANKSLLQLRISSFIEMFPFSVFMLFISNANCALCAQEFVSAELKKSFVDIVYSTMICIKNTTLRWIIGRQFQTANGLEYFVSGKRRKKSNFMRKTFPFFSSSSSSLF